MPDIAGLLVPPGRDYYDWLVRHLGSATGLEFALVGELCGADWDRVRVVSISVGGELGESFEYDLRGTPCSEVMSRDRCVFPRDVARLFPDDRLLAEMGVESYAGVTLVGESGLPLGLMLVMDGRPLAHPGRVIEQLELLRPRTAGELEQRFALRELGEITASTRSTGGEDTLRSLMLNLARSLRVSVAYVGERVGEERVRTLAWIERGEARDDVEYELAGTPCERVYREGRVFHAEGVRSAYPSSPDLVDLDAEGYLGFALRGSEGEVVGHLAIVHDRVFTPRLESSRLLPLTIARVAAEVSRLQMERERRAIDRRLLDAQKTESLGVLAGGVAHDFNNLLVGVLGNASLALADAEEASPLRPYLSEIEQAAQQAADLARQLLAYSGKGHFVVEPVDLSYLVREMSDLMRRSIDRRIRLRVDLASGLPAVMADSTQMRQIVMNLLLNAAEAIGDRDGHVDLRVDQTTIDARDLREAAVGVECPPGGYVRLTVEDDGEGMSAETRRRMFDPFFSTKEAGHGLGLAAALGIIRGHSGALLVRSEPRTGSVFELLLPPTDRRAVERRHDGAAPEWCGVGAALVVDDESTVRRTACRVMRGLGFDVIDAADGAEALEAVRGGVDPAIVLLDVTMPVMGGAETYRELRRTHPDVPVVLTSGYDEAEAVAFACDDRTCFVRKPFSAGELAEAVRTILSSSALR